MTFSKNAIFKRLRKAISLLCAIAVLLSIFTESFLGSSYAAAPAEDTAITVVWDQVALDLTFDGANNGGIAMSNASSKEVKDGAFYLGNVGGSQGSAWLAKDATVNAGATIQSITNKTAANSPKANLFALKGNTSYKITFKYAFRNDTAEGKGLQFMAANDPYLASGHGRGTTLATYIAKTEDAMEAKAGAPAGGTDYGTMKEETFIFTTTTGAEGKFLGFRTASTDVYVKIDDFKIEIGSTTLADLEYDYNFDFKNGETPYVALDIATALGNGTKHYTIVNVDGSKNPANPSFIDEEGYHIVALTANKLPTTEFSWLQNAVLYDTDAVEGGVLKFKQDASYLVSVKFKLVDLGENASATLVVTGNSTKNGNACLSIGSTELSKVSEDWQYLNVVFNATDANVVGKWLYLGTRSSSGKLAKFVIESVTVKEKRDVTNGVAIIETVNGAETNMVMAQAGAVYNLQIPSDTANKSFVGWFTTPDFKEGTKVDITNYIPAKGKNTLYAKYIYTICDVTFDVCGKQDDVILATGMELPRPVSPDQSLLFEGWYTDPALTVPITTVPDDRGSITVYSKFNGTFLSFENISHVDGETTGDPQLVADPNNADNKVVKVTSPTNARTNFMLPMYDAKGSGAFELKTNTTYTMSFKARLVSADGVAAGYQFYRGDGASFKDITTTRTAVSGANGTILDTEWRTYTCTFKTGNTHYLERVKWSYQNHLLFSIYNSKNPLEVYIDDFCIAEVLTEKPEGCVAVKFETNVGTVNTIYGVPGDCIVLPQPTAAGYEFVGWYTDKKLTCPFYDTAFASEDITLYAKWESQPFLVDFSDFTMGTTVERAQFVQDESGNDYLDWWVGHATNNLSDTSTYYRMYLNKNGDHCRVTDGYRYRITLKYKILDSTVNTVSFGAVTHRKLIGWSNYTVQNGSVTVTGPTDDWKTVSFEFVAESVDSNSNYLSLGVANHGHVLIDDIIIDDINMYVNNYGSVKITFDSNGGRHVPIVTADPGDIVMLPKAVRAGYLFGGWYLDPECTKKYTQTVLGDEDLTLYADWYVGKRIENFEDNSKLLAGISVTNGYELHNKLHAGDNNTCDNYSVYVNGKQTVSSAFSLVRDVTDKMYVGNQYTLKLYIKPTKVSNGYVKIVGLNSNTDRTSMEFTENLINVSDLILNEWNIITYTFTNESNYVGLMVDPGNQMYIDDVTLTFKGYWGPATGGEWQEISINSLPFKTQYLIGEELDTTGLVVKLTSISGDEQGFIFGEEHEYIIANDFEISGFDSSTSGTKTVTITFEGLTTEFTVEVLAEDDPYVKFDCPIIRPVKGSTFDVYINVVNLPAIKSLGFNMFNYDDEAFALVNCEILVSDATIKVWDKNNQSIAIMFANNTTVSGNVVKLTFEVIGESVTQSFIDCVVVAKTSSGEAINVKCVSSHLDIVDYQKGDLTGDDIIDSEDVVYVLYHCLYPEEYPANQFCDFNRDGSVDSQDAIYLMYHNLFGDSYPL